jgi:hypothetical protein
MTQLLYITEPATWQQSSAAGEYAMSTRGVTLAEQGSGVSHREVR